MKKVKLKFKKLTDSEKLMVRYLQNRTVNELIVDGKTYTLEELEIIE